MNGYKLLANYYNNIWSKDVENQCRSFTMGACLYDGIKESRFTLEELGVEDYVNDHIEGKSGANREWIEGLSDDTKVEICDISFLYELAEQLEEEHKENLKELYDYLDGTDFVNEAEVNCAVQEYFMENEGVENPSYQECLEYGKLADEYIEDRGLEFKQE